MKFYSVQSPENFTRAVTCKTSYQVGFPNIQGASKSFESFGSEPVVHFNS